jgi:trigger factor
MKVIIETISAVEKKLNFEIPQERVGEELEKVYRSFQHNARIKGFRPGKAPRALIERQFGDQVAAEVGSHLVEESYAQALDDHKLLVVTRPHVVAEKLAPGQPFRYSATVEIRPEISVIEYEGLEVEKQVRQVQDKEVEDALHHLAESFAQLHPVTDRSQIEHGDVIRLDCAAFVNGKPAPGLQSKGKLVEIGRENIFPGFQERLLGEKKGASLEFTLPFPENQEGEGNTSRAADFRVAVHELLRKEVPQLDDEFAKDHGECETLEELRGKVRQNIQQTLDRRAESQLEDAIIAQLVTKNPIEVPPSLIREQEHRMLVEAGVLRPDDDLAAGQAALPEQLREEFSSRARRQVQAFLLLDALANQVGITISVEEMQKRIDDIVAANGIERRQQVAAFYERQENRAVLERRLRQEKTLRLVVDKARVKLVEKNVTEEEAGVAGAEEKD